MFAAKDLLLTRPTAAPPGGGGVGSASYASFPSVPAGTVHVAVTTGAGVPAIVSGTTLQEGNSILTNGGYNSHFVLPDIMAVTTVISVTITVGALSVAANNRGVGPGVFSSDGTKGVYFRFNSQSATATLVSFQSGAETTQMSLASQVAVPADTLTLTGTLSGGVWTWTVKKNGGADISGLTWPDSGHVIDLPGNRVGASFRHQYASGQAPSRGVAALSATAA